MSESRCKQAIEAIDQALASLPVAEIPALTGELKRLETKALARLMQRPEPDTGHLLDAEQVATRLNVPVSYIYEAARRGALTGTKLGKKYIRFSEVAVQAYLARQGV